MRHAVPQSLDAEYSILKTNIYLLLKIEVDMNQTILNVRKRITPKKYIKDYSYLAALVYKLVKIIFNMK